jgi:hypothetical protein
MDLCVDMGVVEDVHGATSFFFFKCNFAVGIAHSEYHDIYLQRVRIVFICFIT